MLVPIGVLAAGSILAGLPFKEVFASPHGVEEFFRESLKMNRTSSRTWSICRAGSRRCPPS